MIFRVSRSRRWGAGGIIVALALGLASAAWGKPMRIASLGLCADQFILGMVEPERIVALSPQATDPALSIHHERAEGLPATRGSAEELIAISPDLAVANRWGHAKTLSLLERLGVPVLRLAASITFDEVMAETDRVARVLGEPGRGRRLIAGARARIAAVAKGPAAKRPRAVYIMPGGYSAGGGTFAHTVITAAGADNLAARLGKTGWTGLSLERLVSEDPEVLIFGFFRPGVHSLASRYRRHTLVRRLVAEKPTIVMPDHNWICGGWFLHEAVTHLARELRP
jgi:iron complex transport system substrate-binding protein